MKDSAAADQGKVHSEFLIGTSTVFVLVFILLWVSSGFKDTAYNGYVLMASQWLDGHVWIVNPPLSVDTILWNGHYQIIEAPMPGLIMLPWVAIMGMNASQELVAVICSAITVAAAYAVLFRMDVPAGLRYALTVFIGFGTALWWCTAFAALWMFAGVVAAMFAMLALAEFYGLRRPWLVGLLIVCAALARMPLILSALPLAIWFWFERRENGAPSPRRLGQFLAGIAPGLIAYVLYNFARYHTFADIGYTVWFHHDQVGQPTGSPFQLQFVPLNLYSYFMLAPEFARTFPWFRPTSVGVSLTLTSPALVLALGAAWRERETWLLWSALLLVAAPSVAYYVNGTEQFGMRHSIDFIAFALPLVARGAMRVPVSLWAPLVGYSILANAYGVWYSWAYKAFAVVPQ